MSEDAAQFEWEMTKSGVLRVGWRGRVVTTLKGGAAERLAARLGQAGSEETQQLLARATGNFRRGNERLARERSAGKRRP